MSLGPGVSSRKSPYQPLHSTVLSDTFVRVKLWGLTLTTLAQRARAHNENKTDSSWSDYGKIRVRTQLDDLSCLNTSPWANIGPSAAVIYCYSIYISNNSK